MFTRLLAWIRCWAGNQVPDDSRCHNTHVTSIWWYVCMINTLRPWQNGRHFADHTFKRIILNETVRILIKISLKLVPKGSFNYIPELVQVTAWCRLGDKPLSGPMMVRLPTNICVTRSQWVKLQGIKQFTMQMLLHKRTLWSSYTLPSALLDLLQQTLLAMQSFLIGIMLSASCHTSNLLEIIGGDDTCTPLPIHPPPEFTYVTNK